jgi:hypothetical protein
MYFWGSVGFERRRSLRRAVRFPKRSAEEMGQRPKSTGVLIVSRSSSSRATESDTAGLRPDARSTPNSGIRLMTSCAGHSGRPKMFVTILCTSPGSRRVTQALNSVAVGSVRISLPLAVVCARVGYIGTLRLRGDSASCETLPFNEGSLFSAGVWLPLAGFAGGLGASSIAWQVSLHSSRTLVKNFGRELPRKGLISGLDGNSNSYDQKERLWPLPPALRGGARLGVPLPRR